MLPVLAEPIAVERAVAPPTPSLFGSWLARATLAAAIPPGGKEGDLLGLEGYDRRLRFSGTLDGGWIARDVPIGVGGFVGGAASSDDGPRGQLVERSFSFGGEGMWVVGISEGAAIVLAPRIGYGRVALGLHTAGRTYGVFLWGGEASLLFLDGHLGVVAGWMRGITAPIGGLGLPYDMGGGYLGFSGAFHG